MVGGLTRWLCPGMAVGHCYYFIEDIFPQQPGGWRILRTPRALRCEHGSQGTPRDREWRLSIQWRGLDLTLPPRVLCDPVVEDPAYQPEPQDRPGGFLWGQVAPTCYIPGEVALQSLH